MDRLSSDTLLWCSMTDGRGELDAADREADGRELHQAVRAAVASVLTARQRQVVEGYFFEGLSQSELASKLGITQQVVHKCLYGTRRNGRLVGGALKRLHDALSPLVHRHGSMTP